MQLSAKFKAFDKPTMIVVTDNVRAKLFLAKDRDVELVHMISKKAESTDGEHNLSVNAAGPHGNRPDPHNREWSREQLYEALSPELMLRMAKGEFERLAFCAPEEDMNDLKESMHIDLLKRVDAYVEKNLCNDELPDIILHVQMAE
jgi:protein required for attachment to host cells